MNIQYYLIIDYADNITFIIIIYFLMIILFLYNYYHWRCSFENDFITINITVQFYKMLIPINTIKLVVTVIIIVVFIVIISIII